jgi:NADPH:quinone reductase-like Zn-dependent oxidoreductase
MRAAVLHAFDQAPHVEEFQDPAPEEGEVAVDVRAAAIHPLVRALASGAHYGAEGSFPSIPGIDGVGSLEDGSRVYFGNVRPPYGTLAERAVVMPARTLPLPDGLDDDTAAALINPGMSAWLALAWRAPLSGGETVLVLGATGTAGKLAVQVAKLLGAARVVAAGRDEQVLASLSALGADATIRLDLAETELVDAFAREAAQAPFDVVVDYLWGRPTEALLAALARTGLTHAAPRVRLVEVGESAGPTISLPADVLRSSGLELVGSGAGTIPVEEIMKALPEVIERAARGDLRADPEVVPISEIEAAWTRGDRLGRRIVIVP